MRGTMATEYKATTFYDHSYYCATYRKVYDWIEDWFADHIFRKDHSRIFMSSDNYAFRRRFELTDANGIMDLSNNESESGCVVELSGAGTYKVFDNATIHLKDGNVYEVWNLPATGEGFNETEEALYLTVTARDKADKTKVYKETLYADNAAPEVSFVTNKSVYNGGGSETISFTFSNILTFP